MNKIIGLPLLTTLLVLFSPSILAEIPVYELLIKNHQFYPALLEIPQGQKIKLLVKNQDATPEEFESYELHREKIIPGNSQVVIFIGPLTAGEYPFFGEFNMKTAQGKIVAK